MPTSGQRRLSQRQKRNFLIARFLGAIAEFVEAATSRGLLTERILKGAKLQFASPT